MELLVLIGLLLLGALLVIFTPQFMGAVVLLVVIFAVSILNYRRTRELHAGMQEIRRHMGLMREREAEKYDLDRELNRVNALNDAEREAIDGKTEIQLWQQNRPNGE
ncbi:hypothetical protein QWJ34_12165 [Saccharibacillus sp. CPCC 101409]|uniref:hypothetical protein n=1 Tax=Saccharibacillus sp. CPCC 101409 TaxID=3058041 RepID=UPI0026731C76|nr:hypothetical protein [Saccharibacillus sp. CPCC 101409]MDO3410517.1 hypothetical protein [Saccharibacillus sp. CPCC 101409]